MEAGCRQTRRVTTSPGDGAVDFTIHPWPQVPNPMSPTEKGHPIDLRLGFHNEVTEGMAGASLSTPPRRFLFQKSAKFTALILRDAQELHLIQFRVKRQNTRQPCLFDCVYSILQFSLREVVFVKFLMHQHGKKKTVFPPGNVSFTVR